MTCWRRPDVDVWIEVLLTMGSPLLEQILPFPILAPIFHFFPGECVLQQGKVAGWFPPRLASAGVPSWVHNSGGKGCAEIPGRGALLQPLKCPHVPMTVEAGVGRRLPLH